MTEVRTEGRAHTYRLSSPTLYYAVCDSCYTLVCAVVWSASSFWRGRKQHCLALASLGEEPAWLARTAASAFPLCHVRNIEMMPCPMKPRICKHRLTPHSLNMSAIASRHQSLPFLHTSIRQHALVTPSIYGLRTCWCLRRLGQRLQTTLLISSGLCHAASYCSYW